MATATATTTLTPAPRKRRISLRLLRTVVGYVSFSVTALIVAGLVTFPYDALKERIRLEADAQGLFVRIGSLGPGFFGLRASDLRVSKKAVPGPGDDKPPEALEVDSITIGPSLFPLGVAVRAKLLGGSAKFAVGGLSTKSLRINLDGLDLSKGNMKGFSGIDFSGTLDGNVDLAIPTAAIGAGPAEPDLGQASGTVALDTHALTINGGTASVTIPMYGPEPTPLDLPKIVLGDITGRLKFDKGAGTVEDFKGKSSDLEANITGTLKLAKRVEYSEPALELRFKPDPEFQKRLGLIGSALSAVGSDPKDPSWRLGKLTGYLGRPAFR